MIRAYVYELEKPNNKGFDKLKFVVDSQNSDEAKNLIQSHYSTYRKRNFLYAGGNHITHKSSIHEIEVDNNLLSDPNVIKIQI